jgi:hypothetical protein
MPSHSPGFNVGQPILAAAALWAALEIGQF